LGSIGNIATLGTLSPRLMGEVAYGAGRASVPIGNLIDTVQSSPAALLAAQRGLAAGEATEAERAQQELFERYGLSLPPTISSDGTLEEQVTPEILRLAAEQPEPGINLGGFKPTYSDVEPEAAPAQTTQIIDGRITDIDPDTGKRVFLDTKEPVMTMQRGGMVRGYNRGGMVLGELMRMYGVR
jgi:hypothetical protein